MAIFGCFQVKDGLDLTDVVPKGTKISDFLEIRYKYFSFYDIVIVTKSGYDYPNGQEKLYQLHSAFEKVQCTQFLFFNGALYTVHVFNTVIIKQSALKLKVCGHRFGDLSYWPLKGIIHV